MRTLKSAMTLVGESIVSTTHGLFLAALKSLICAPIFYVWFRLTQHHAPPSEVWYGFGFAAALFLNLR